MERITVFDGEFWAHKNFPPVKDDTVDEFVDCVKELAARLAAYEDTGLEPEAVEHLKLASMGKAIAKIKEFEGVPVNRLRELAQADREGRVKIDPKALKCPKCGKMRLFPRIDWQYYYCYSCKTQFPREAAEAALKEREADHDR